MSESDSIWGFISSVDVPELSPGGKETIIPGMEIRKNQRNPFTVIRLHYSAHPGRREGTPEGDAWLEAEMRQLGCYRACRPCDRQLSLSDERCPDCSEPSDLVLSNRWRKEHEIDYGAQRGSYVFDSFSRGRNTCDPFRIPSTWRRWRSIDYGYRNPTHVLWIAVDPDGHCWVYREYREAEKTVDQHARSIHLLSAKADRHVLEITDGDLRYMEHPDWSPSHELRSKIARTYRTIGDPSMDRRTQKDMATVMERFRRNHIHIRKAKNAMAGIETMQNMFSNGSLTIFNNLSHLIREIENLTWAEHADPTRNQKERPVDKDDHGVDALRYFVNEFAPPAASTPIPSDDSTPEGVAEMERQRYLENRP